MHYFTREQIKILKEYYKLDDETEKQKNEKNLKTASMFWDIFHLKSLEAVAKELEAFLQRIQDVDLDLVYEQYNNLLYYSLTESWGRSSTQMILELPYWWQATSDYCFFFSMIINTKLYKWLEETTKHGYVRKPYSEDARTIKDEFVRSSSNQLLYVYSDVYKDFGTDQFVKDCAEEYSFYHGGKARDKTIIYMKYPSCSVISSYEVDKFYIDLNAKLIKYPDTRVVCIKYAIPNDDTEKEYRSRLEAFIEDHLNISFIIHKEIKDFSFNSGTYVRNERRLFYVFKIVEVELGALEYGQALDYYKEYLKGNGMWLPDSLYNCGVNIALDHESEIYGLREIRNFIAKVIRKIPDTSKIESCTFNKCMTPKSDYAFRKILSFLKENHENLVYLKNQTKLVKMLINLSRYEDNLYVLEKHEIEK